jgi:uncharacterized protein YggE
MRMLIMAMIVMSVSAAVRGDDTVFAPGVRCIEVTGSGRATTVPDVAVLKLEVQATGQDIRELKEQVDTSVAKLLSLARQLNMRSEDVMATQLVIGPEYDRRSSEKGVIRNNVSRSVTLRIKDLEHVPKAIDGAIAAGVSRIPGLQLESSRANEIAADALVKAIADAHVKAEAIAKHLNVKLGRVLRASPIYSRFDQLVVMYSAVEAPEQFNVGEIVSDAEMNVVYEIVD